MKRMMTVLALALIGCGKSDTPVSPTPEEPTPTAVAKDPVVPPGRNEFLDFILPDKPGGDFYRIRIAPGSSIARGLVYMDKGPASGWAWGTAWTKLRWDEQNIYLVEERAEVAFSMTAGAVFKRRWTPRDGPEGGAWKADPNFITWYQLGTCNVRGTGRQPIYYKLAFVGPMDGRPEVAVVEHQYGKTEVEVSKFTREEGGYSWERHATGLGTSSVTTTHPPCTPDTF